MQRTTLTKSSSIAILLLSAIGTATAEDFSHINPTGAYSLRSKKERVAIKNNGAPPKYKYVPTGFSGEIKVTRVDNDHILVNMNGNKGFPSFNQGAFTVTIAYKNNTAIYTPLEYDMSCVITMKFEKTAVIVSQVSNDPNAACGFGHAVAVDGVYKKHHQKVLR